MCGIFVTGMVGQAEGQAACGALHAPILSTPANTARILSKDNTQVVTSKYAMLTGAQPGPAVSMPKARAVSTIRSPWQRPSTRDLYCPRAAVPCPSPQLPANCYRPRCRAYASPKGSFDSQDELDKSLADEFDAITDPKRMERMKRHFDLMWRVTKAKKNSVQTCSCCQGSGENECGWCHGTGVMTVGDKLFLNNNGGKCPVCKGTGYVKCDHCRGTGSRAQWLGDDDPQKHRGQSAPQT